MKYKVREYLIAQWRKLIQLFISKEDDLGKATFRNMVIITYGITFFVTFAMLFLQFDSFNDGKIYSFGCTENISIDLYILASVCQSLVPTTVTFGGTVLILQSLSGYAAAGRRSLLFVSIVALAVINVVQNAVRGFLFLQISSILAIAGCVATLILSKDCFSIEIEDDGNGQKQKKEKSDCNPSA